MTDQTSTGTGTATGTRTRLTTTAAVTAVLALGALGGSSAGAAAEDVRPTAATGKAQPPKTGEHCDAVEGRTAFGQGKLPTPTN